MYVCVCAYELHYEKDKSASELHMTLMIYRKNCNKTNPEPCIGRVRVNACRCVCVCVCVCDFFASKFQTALLA